MATSGKDFRLESDLIGERQISNEHLYGVQTLRGMENFQISVFHLADYPLFIHGLAWTKEAAAIANHRLGLLTDQQKDAIVQACHELLEGKHHQHFPVDMIQGGAGTTTNMNANEVICNRALEIMGHEKGEFKYLSPNDHVNSPPTMPTQRLSTSASMLRTSSSVPTSSSSSKLWRRSLRSLPTSSRWAVHSSRTLYL